MLIVIYCIVQYTLSYATIFVFHTMNQFLSFRSRKLTMRKLDKAILFALLNRYYHGTILLQKKIFPHGQTIRRLI
jgi:hypothetical protein